MLKLYIDGHPVNISKGTRTDYYEKNPFFTNEGDYTLDIDINLNDPQNAKLYNYIHRMDRVRRTSRREAILMDERGVLMRGQEVVLGTQNGVAKIQIVGGVSELNYLMGDKKLQDLDLWSPFDSDEVVYPPVCSFNESPHAEFGLMDSTQFDDSESARKLVWQIVNNPNWRVSDNALVQSNPCPQPYFWAIINRVITALGFGVGTNVVQTDPRYSQMIMVHAFRSRYIADILPRWTVSEFFDEIQKFFNVIVSVNKATHEVNIEHAWSFLDPTTMVTVKHEDIIDLVEKDFDHENEMTMVSYNSVHYKLTDKTINKYAALEANLVRDCDIIAAETVSGARAYDAHYNVGIWKAIIGDESFLQETSPTPGVEGNYGRHRIFTQTIDGEERRFVLWSVEDNYCAMKMVDMFGSKKSVREGDPDVEMRIVPARMVTSPIKGNNSHWWQYPLPAVDGEASSQKGFSVGMYQSEEPNENINDDIKTGYKEEESDDRADVMFAAFYFGQLPINWEDPVSQTPSGLVVPVASPDYLVQLHRLSDSPADGIFWRCARTIKLGSDLNRTMAIRGEHGMDAYSYSKNPLVDTSVEYKVRFRCARALDVRRVWLIENRRFYCKELKYDIADGRRSEVVEGRFFPLLEAGAGEGGESVFYVSYNLSRVVIDHRVLEVAANDTLHLELKLEGGGSASAVIAGTIVMGNVDVTSSALTVSGRTATVHIDHVTGDVLVKAWKA